MRVSLLYVCAFKIANSDDNTEVESYVDHFERKYGERGTTVTTLSIPFNPSGKDGASASAKSIQKGLGKSGWSHEKSLKTRDATATAIDPIMGPGRHVEGIDGERVEGEATVHNYGVGIYFIFPGGPGKPKVSPGTTAQMVQRIADRHPPGCLRKVSVLSCFYAKSEDLPRSSLEALGRAILKRKLKNPPLLASYDCVVEPPGEDGHKFFPVGKQKVFMRFNEGAYETVEHAQWTDKVA